MRTITIPNDDCDLVEGAIQVLTPLAACALFGRSGEAVRRAAREGLVRTRLELLLTATPVRLLDLQSALDYWAENPWPAWREPLVSEVRRMRGYGLTVHAADEWYQVLHPWPLVDVHRVDKPILLDRER